jgi:hypothetical protein
MSLQLLVPRKELQRSYDALGGARYTGSHLEATDRGIPLPLATLHLAVVPRARVHLSLEAGVLVDLLNFPHLSNLRCALEAQAFMTIEKTR